MRLHIKIKPSKKTIPFNYQPILASAIHRWIGSNKYHDSLSLYSFSWLQGGMASKNGLCFPKGGKFFVSSVDSEMLISIIKGVDKLDELGNGLAVEEIVIQKEPDFGLEQVFYTASPVLVKRKIDSKEKHFTYKDTESDSLLTETLKSKLEATGKNGHGLKVQFDRTYHSPKTKLVYYRQIGNKVNICPVKITGNPEQLAFAWNVGIGNSTGIGFGALK